MKPIFLEIQAFGPYADRQTVDFARLSRAGIFLIKGPTGSGKTTIFDAMMFALYGGSSGSDEKERVGRNDLEEWRCNQADSKLPTEVSFTFSIGGKTYQFARRLVPKRKKLSAEYMAGELDEEGNLFPFFENPKKDDLTQKAEELIGLTREQFRKVILLPQGQFEKFLTAGAEEKEEILKLIFDTKQWERYAVNYYEAANARRNALTKEKGEIDLALAEEGAASLEQLVEGITELEESIRRNKAEREEYAAEQKQAALNEDIRLYEQFRPLRDLEKKERLLAAKKDEFDRMGAQYRQAERAETLRAMIDQTENLYREQQKWVRRLEEKQRELPKIEEKLKAAQEKKTAHDAEDPTKELMAQIGTLQNKRSVYQEITELRNGFRKADNELRDAEKKVGDAAEALSRENMNFRTVNQRMDAARKVADDYRSRYFAGIYGELAQKLEENQPCPVCGSRNHPQPAPKAPNSVSKPDVERAEQEVRKAWNLWGQAEQRRTDAEKTKTAAAQTAADARNRWTEAKTSLNRGEESLIPGIRDLPALDNAVRKLNSQIQSYATAGQTIQNEMEACSRLLADVNADLKNCKAAYQEAESSFAQCKVTLDAALADKGYATAQEAKRELLPYEERQKMYTALISYEQSVAAVRRDLELTRQKLAGLTEPDQAGFAQRQKEISEAVERFSRLDTQYRNTQKRLAEKQKKLQDRSAHYKANIQQAEDDFTFAKKLRGDSGVGLHRYILSVMFGQMLGEANRMLSKVHGGRYQLHQTFEKSSGNKRGLNLKVYDSRSPEKEGRSVAMLSGGEKFLVSLSLSIGISAVAQSSGIRVETLFIDEGFGTLDHSSINDAMDILESVRRSNGMIGIISHVPLLESNIPVHLEVIKSNSGSRILPV